VIDYGHLPLPKDFVVRDRSVVSLPAGQIAGNHRHPRQEAYLCCDLGAEMHWLDEDGKVRIDKMGTADGPLEQVEAMEVTVLVEKAAHAARSEAEVAGALSNLQPGVLPFDIFHAIARLMVMPIIEVVPLRRGPEGRVEILLLKREANDPVWPRQLHVPGTVVRASDEAGSFRDALTRVLEGELKQVEVGEPVLVKNILHHSGRGMEASQVFWVEVRGEAGKREFYDAEHLPDTIVKSQLDFIPDAIAHFKTTNVYLI
jgi:hypothetical protein